MIRFPTSPWGLSPPVAFADSARSPSPPTSLRRVTQQEETHRGPKGPKEGALLRLLLGPPSLKKSSWHSLHKHRSPVWYSLPPLSFPPSTPLRTGFAPVSASSSEASRAAQAPVLALEDVPPPRFFFQPDSVRASTDLFHERNCLLCSCSFSPLVCVCVLCAGWLVGRSLG